MGHLEVKGFEMHIGHISTTGLEKRIFRRFEMVLSGHFHKKSDDGQIYFLGSPCFSSTGSCMVNPRALPRGIMVTLCTGSAPSV